MAIQYTKKGNLSLRALFEDERTLLVHFLDDAIERFMREQATAMALDSLDPLAPGAGKQAEYCRQVGRGLRQLLATVLQSGKHLKTGRTINGTSDL